MESLIIWLGTGGLILFIILPYFLNFRRKQREDAVRREEAVRLGADKTVAQFPQVDPFACIGCASCVAACPEGEVLGIVNGKAAIINGLKCVGHGRCAEACPVGAIVVGLGDIEKRDDIPLLNKHQETSVERVFIAGELSGLALIRNAIGQGREVVEHIAQNGRRIKDPQVHDVAIVGAGPAGLTAALTAVQHNLSHIIIDQQGAGGTILHYPRKKLVMTRPVEIPLYGWLNKPEYSKEELLEIWQGIQNKFDLHLRIGDKLQNVVRNNGHYEVQTHNGVYYARNVVLALGRRGTPRKLNVPGEELSKVMYKLIDAESYQNEHLLVVGGGDSAIEAAIGLANQPGNRVTISYRKDKFFRIKRRNEQRLSEYIRSGRIQVVFNSQVICIEEKIVRLKTVKEDMHLPNDYTFIFAGGEPPFQLLKKIGIRFGGEN
ncbi:MAG TPA: 4Fe-4S dicluster domain-containing protein [Caldithrix abyssi]|uniref:4Fe-4S dicluster domain-containing protein n=1 Tax=Caldithrix abyssi TaxID=187145 RepID=A0A7V4U157_CALAY|nr:4Fe-4S dicluster domain-containing protein [Caldithrix abyssi]